MYSVRFYAQIVRALDEIDAPYVIVGALRLWNNLVEQAQQEIQDRK